jgi:translation initiation factor IF-1
MSKEELISMEGEVVLVAKAGNFKVRLDSGHVVSAKLAGKIRKNHIRIVLGDKVVVGVSPYDANRGIITYRQK